MAGAIETFNLLTVGVSENLLKELSTTLVGLQVRSLNNVSSEQTLFEDFDLAPGTHVLVSDSNPGAWHMEVAQTLNSSFSGLRLAFVTTDRNQFRLADLKKNGFADTFFWPMDRQQIETWIEGIRKSSGGGRKKFKNVKILDIQPGLKLPFAVHSYLPLNDKYIQLTATGEISERKIKVLQEQNVSSVYVTTDEIEKFYEFTADQLINLGDMTNNKISQTEKIERFHSSVRDLFRSVLDTSGDVADFQRGREFLEQASGVINKYVEKKTGVNLQEQLRKVITDSGDFYLHAQAVSTIAALISLATGIGQPEDLALAGLFHDIGVSGKGIEVTPFDLNRLSEIDRKEYLQHPRASLNLLRQKRITVSQEIADIIERHHERFDGKGYPGALAAHRIPAGAHVLSYADAFEYLSRPIAGQPRKTNLEIHEIIVKELSLNPEMLAQVKKLFISN